MVVMINNLGDVQIWTKNEMGVRMHPVTGWIGSPDSVTAFELRENGVPLEDCTFVCNQIALSLDLLNKGYELWGNGEKLMELQT